MRPDAVSIEEDRIGDVHRIADYPSLHERHRIFPAILSVRNHKNALDVAAGVGVVGKRIMEGGGVDILCNDISPTCLQTMQAEGIKTVSFDIDDPQDPFPFPDGHFDAVIALSTIEHVIHIDHFVSEMKRVLSANGCLYISSPNYAGLIYLLPLLLSGRTFHDPLVEKQRYEFLAHVRYFTHTTLLEYVGSFGLNPEAVYLPLPQSGSRYVALKRRSRLQALLFRTAMHLLYASLGPRWASEPVICFRKNGPSIKCPKVEIV